MAYQCRQCGAELLPEMRFCRRCGHATGLLPVTEGPTRELQSTADPSVPGGTTSNYAPQQAYFPTAPPLTRRRRIWPWFLGGFLALVLGSATAVGFFLYRIRDRLPASIEVGDEGTKIITQKGDQIVIPSGEGGPTEMRTISTHRLPLSEGDELTIGSVAGRVRISTSDEEGEIKLIRHGVELGEASAVDLQVNRSGSKVSVKAQRSGGAAADVDFEIRIPPGVHLASVETISGPIRITGTSGPINAKSASGEIRIEAESGSVAAKTASGSISVVLSALRPGQAIDLSSASGNIRLQVKEEFNADLEVKTLTGTLKIDPSLGLEPEHKLVSRRLRGRVGSGATSVNIKTISGNITIGE